MEQKLQFPNAKGDKLSAVLEDPTGNKPNLMLIFCHGFSSSKDSPSYVGLRKILHDHGISSFRFDFYGHGESEGKFEDITITEAVDDTLCAISFCREKGYTKIGLFGTSFGGIAALIAASKRKDLRLLVLKSPVSNHLDRDMELKSDQELAAWKKDGFKMYDGVGGQKLRLNYTFFEDFKNNDGYKAAQKIRIPTLIVHGDADDIVPVAQSIKTASLIKGCRLEIIHGADHRYSDPIQFKQMTDFVVRFILGHS